MTRPLPLARPEPLRLPTWARVTVGVVCAYLLVAVFIGTVVIVQGVMGVPEVVREWLP